MDLTKAHAYGNDFLFVPASQTAGRDGAALARALCERHTGVGGDGLILYEPTTTGARMKLFNADGSPAEISGNGVRCLAAIVCRSLGASDRPVPTPIVIETDAGPSHLTLLASDGPRFTFRAWMGQPADIRRAEIDIGAERVQAVTLSVGNPQCVVLGEPLSVERMHRLGPVLATHPMFRAGTNVSLVQVERPDRIRILIWERGVGPTSSSGTGACGAAVAAAAHGGAGRDVEVVAPGGSQRVTWTDEGIHLTGWAEIVFEGSWPAKA